MMSPDEFGVAAGAPCTSNRHGVSGHGASNQASAARLAELPLRSLLFVPADSARKIEKAMASAADMLILDLEDAVAPEAKVGARTALYSALAGRRAKRIAVRINAVDTPWYLGDLASLGRCLPDVVMLPKCGGPEDIRRLDAQLSLLEAITEVPVGSTGILPLVTETATALGAMDYRGVSARLCGLAFAGEDLAADLGVAARDETGLNPLLAEARRAVAIAAAAAGVPAIDTPFPDFRDSDGLTDETATALRLGYAGKMCIHPDQIAAVEQGLRPTDTQLAWARTVVGLLTGMAAGGVAALDGKMIDGAHLRLARRYLARTRPPAEELFDAD